METSLSSQERSAERVSSNRRPMLMVGPGERFATPRRKNPMSQDEVEREAAAVGLRLNPAQLEEFARASALARRLAQQLPRDLPFAEEPATAPRLKRRAPR
jgi:hypothetical protein